MSNYRRVYQPGGCYFFTQVCWQRRPIFAEEDAVNLLKEALRQVKKQKPFEIDAIAILPDHIHCIWNLPEGDSDYSGRWREIKKYVTKRMAVAVPDKPMQIWQPRFWEHLIRDETDWRHHMDYIHYNPVKHGLVKRPGDWPYSSFHSSVRKGWYAEDWGGDSPPHIQAMELE